MEKAQHIPAPAPAPSPPESPSLDIEMGFAAPTEPANLSTLASQPSVSRQHHRHRIYPEWLALIMGFCFTAIGIGLQCQDSVHLSISLQTARLGLVFALSAFVVSKYIPPNLGAHAQVLEYAGVFCGVTAFFLAITVTFPLCLKIISWIIYAVSFVAIILFPLLGFFQVELAY